MKKLRVAAVLGLACSATAPHAGIPQATEVGVSVSQESVEMNPTGVRVARPPMVRVMFDVHLRNPTNEPRWFLIPTVIDAPSSGGVFAAETFGAGGTHLTRFLGRGGFVALRLAPETDLTVRNVELQSWDEAPLTGTRTVVVRSGSRLALGGEPAEGWTGQDPLTPARGDIDAATLPRSGSHSRPDASEVLATLDDGRAIPVSVSFP